MTNNFNNFEEYQRVGGHYPIYVPKHAVEEVNRRNSPSSVFSEEGKDAMYLSERLSGGMSRVIGHDGVPIVGGSVDIDHNPNLESWEWRGSFDKIGIVDKMVREDPVCQAIRLAWTLPLLSVQWSIQPASEDAEHVRVAEFVESVLFEHMRGGWLSFLEQAIQFTWRGLSVFEIVARYDKELNATVIDRLAPRLPWTIYTWQRYPDGRFGITQYPSYSDPVVGKQVDSASRFGDNPVLPPDKLVMFRFQPEGDNPEPMGILRPCYSAWRQRRTYLTLEATGFERSSYGIPYVEVEPGANPADVDQVNIILRELRSGIRSFAMFPRGFKLQFAEFPMKASEIREARIAAGQDMARAGLSQFLFTGENSGAYSLIQGQLDHYTMALQHAANNIATTMSQGPHSIIKRLVSWNFPGTKEFPYLQAGEVRVGDPKQLVEAVKAAVDAGVVHPDRHIEDKVRDVLSLPIVMQEEHQSPEEDQDVQPGPDIEEKEAGPEPSVDSVNNRGDEQAKTEEEDLAAAEKINMSPPDAVKSELRRGLAWHEEGHSGDGLRPATVSWARRMAGGEPISRDKAIKMRAWLARHAEDKKGKGFDRGEEGYPSPGRVAWALWGGDPAVGWSNKIVSQIRSREAASETMSEGCGCESIRLDEPSQAKRVAADRFVSGPRGREVMAVERVVRYSETIGATNVAKEVVAATVADWRQEVAPEYASLLSRTSSLIEMSKVEVPKKDALVERITDELRRVYESGIRSAEREVDRQKEGLAPKVGVRDLKMSMNSPDAGVLDALVLAKKVVAPEPSPGESPTAIQEINPEKSIGQMAFATTEEAAARVRADAILAAQAAGLGGELPSEEVIYDVVEDTVSNLSVGPDKRAAQKNVNVVFDLGRMQQLRGDPEVVRYMYSNLLESNTCDPCESHDGEMFYAGDLDFYATPAVWCLGGNMCNCLIIGIVD